jgi:hypothetical protein
MQRFMLSNFEWYEKNQWIVQYKLLKDKKERKN